MEPSFCLTLDIDWAHDDVIADTLMIVEQHGVRATWFVTHATPLLAEILEVPGQELGLHPNFNPLLDGRSSDDARRTLARLLDLVPYATSVRSHSLVRSSRLAAMFVEHGITHESNYLLPPSLGSGVRPWRDFSGLVQVPIRWEDDVCVLDPSLGEPADHLGKTPFFVVNFHPIHVFLNTVSNSDYEAARPDMGAPDALLDRRRPAGSAGTRDRLLSFLAASKAKGMTGVRVCDVKISDRA